MRGFGILILLAGCATPAAEPVEPGVIAGTVALKGAPTGDVFVFIREGLEGRRFEVPAEPVVLDQAGFRFSPRVFGIRAGQTLRITSQDTSQHNVHAQPFRNPPFNQNMFDGDVIEKRFEAAETMILFQCHFHPEMKAYAGVLDHPFFAVTGPEGTFALKGVPPGRYVVEAWQEDRGSKRLPVTLPPDRGARLEFVFD